MDTEWTIPLGSRMESTKCDETSPRLMGTQDHPKQRNARLYQNRHVPGKKSTLQHTRLNLPQPAAWPAERRRAAQK